DLSGPDRRRLPRDPPPGPRASRRTEAPGRRDRLHGSLRGLGAARGVALPGTRPRGPREEALSIREPEWRRGRTAPSPSTSAGKLVAGQRPAGISSEPAEDHVVCLTALRSSSVHASKWRYVRPA